MTNISFLAASAYNKKFTSHAKNLAAGGAIAGRTTETYITAFERGTTNGIQSTDINYINQVGDTIESFESSNFAIDGQGLAIVKNQPNSTGNLGFCRNGTFTVDADFNLANNIGQYLQGYPTDSDGNPINSDVSTVKNLETVNVKEQVLLPQQTNNIKLALSLKSQEAVNGTYETSVPVFDSHGNSHNLTTIFTKQNNNTELGEYDIWTIKMEDTQSGGTVEGGYGVGSVTIAFDANGKPLGYNLTGPTTTTSATAPAAGTNYTASGQPYEYTTTAGGVTTTHKATTTAVTDGSETTYTTIENTYDNVPPKLNVSWADATTSNITINPGTIGKSDGIFVTSGYSQYGIEQDGYGTGTYTGFEISKEGFCVLKYSNGQSIKKFQIPLATFNNVNGLAETSPGVYQTTSASGNYNFQFPGQQNAGLLVSNSYEGSAVDTTKVYLDMIDTQRIYTSNLKAIEISKEMQNKLNNI